jgi:AFG3 family protein
MDEEARILSEEAYSRTITLMEKYKEDVEKVAELLLQQETISHTDVAKLIGDRKFSAGAEYDEFVSMKKKMDAAPAEEEVGASDGKEDEKEKEEEKGHKKDDETAVSAPAV